MPDFAEPLASLIQEFKRLPGIGQKSAQRLAFHVLINWSALLVTVAVAAQLQPGPARTAIARACVVAAAAVWLYFNLLHRQHDRARNLLLTTTFAAAVAIAATLILRQAP